MLGLNVSPVSNAMHAIRKLGSNPSSPLIFTTFALNSGDTFAPHAIDPPDPPPPPPAVPSRTKSQLETERERMNTPIPLLLPSLFVFPSIVSKRLPDAPVTSPVCLCPLGPPLTRKMSP